MVRVRVRVKEPDPLQKPWTRKESLFLQPKSEAGVGRIRFLVRQYWDFHPAPGATHVRVWASHFRYHLYLLGCCQSDTCSIAARASMEILASLLLLLFHRQYYPDLLGCCQSKVVDRAPPLLLLFHHQCHPYLRYCYWSQIEDSPFPCTLFYFYFYF